MGVRDVGRGFGDLVANDLGSPTIPSWALVSSGLTSPRKKQENKRRMSHATRLSNGRGAFSVCDLEVHFPMECAEFSKE
jgi:hypothetical protein